MTLKKLSAIAVFAACSACTFTASAMPITTDIITVVDESGSMSNEQAWLGGMISSLDQALLSAAGNDVFDPRYGLVGYGSSSRNARAFEMSDGANWGSAAEFDAATANLQTSGYTEDGYEAVDFVLNTFDFRRNADKHVMLITDEDRDIIDDSTYQSILDDLLLNSVTLNVMVAADYQCEDGRSASGINADGTGVIITDTGFEVCANASAVRGAGSTIMDYVDLALASGGSSWSTYDFRSGDNAFVNAFSSAFVDVTVGQIEDNLANVPAPATAGLLALGLLGVASRRKK